MLLWPPACAPGPISVSCFGAVSSEGLTFHPVQPGDALQPAEFHLESHNFLGINQAAWE